MMILVLRSLANTNLQYLAVQSQLRIGLKDYGFNDIHIESFFSYFKDQKGYKPILEYPSV
jgi:hypothetical protein